MSLFSVPLCLFCEEPSPICDHIYVILPPMPRGRQLPRHMAWRACGTCADTWAGGRRWKARPCQSRRRRASWRTTGLDCLRIGGEDEVKPGVAGMAETLLYLMLLPISPPAALPPALKLSSACVIWWKTISCVPVLSSYQTLPHEEEGRKKHENKKALNKKA